LLFKISIKNDIENIDTVKKLYSSSGPSKKMYTRLNRLLYEISGKDVPGYISRSILEEDGYYLTLTADAPVCKSCNIKISQIRHIE